MKRFHDKYVQLDRGYETPCWVWVAGKDRDGYGRFGMDGKTMAAHRASWLLFVGELPSYPEKEIDHLCRQRDCVNPSHLRAVSHNENCEGIRTFADINREKTHCAKGHPLTKDNVYPRKHGHRTCRTCQIEWSRAYRASRRSA